MSERLNIQQMTKAAIEAERSTNWLVKTIQQSAEINERIKVFEAALWFPRLQAMVNGTDSRGMSGNCRDVKVMTWCCAGRCLIQLEKPGARVTIITADDEKPWRRDMAHVAPGMGPMGLQSIDAEFLDALVMLYTVTRYGDEITLAADQNVSVG